PFEPPAEEAEDEAAEPAREGVAAPRDSRGERLVGRGAGHRRAAGGAASRGGGGHIHIEAGRGAAKASVGPGSVRTGATGLRSHPFPLSPFPPLTLSPSHP